MTAILEVWNLLDAAHRRRLPLLILVSMCMATATLVGIAAVLPFFAVLADPAALHRQLPLLHVLAAWSPNDDRTLRMALALIFVAGVFAANAINLFGTLITTRYAYAVGNAFHGRLFAAYLNCEYALHLERDGASLARNVLHETSRLSMGLVQNGLMFLTSSITVVFIVGSLLYVNPTVAVATMLGFGTVYVLIYLRFRQKLSRHGFADSANFHRRIRIVNEGFGAIKELTLLESRSLFLDRFNLSCEQIAHTAVSTVTISLAPKYVLECLTAAGLAAVAIYLSARSSNSIWLAQLSFIGLACYRLLPALQQMFAAIVKIRCDSPALVSVASDLRGAPDAGAAPEPALRDPSWSIRPKRHIEFDHVTFFYPTRGHAAVLDLNMRFTAGSIVGFIGANGSGKTTTADLLLGLLAPRSGQIRVDGIALDAANRRAWRSSVAYVPQQIFLIDATIAENIALGAAAADIDRARLHEAARLAGAATFIDSLPSAYEERVGERGIRLSGGQRQRIAIARALYRHARLLVMDEATSALDGLTESDLMVMLETLRGRCTLIFIAHRPSTIRACDLVFEFEAGRVRQRQTSAAFPATKASSLARSP